jgi:hypothetical protein
MSGGLGGPWAFMTKCISEYFEAESYIPSLARQEGTTVIQWEPIRTVRSRFITYLAYKYGIDKLKKFYARSDSSKAFYASQFRKTYGRPVREVWEDWMVWENDFQQGNIARIKEFPLTEFYPLTADPLGSVSKFEYNQSTGKLYAAITIPGYFTLANRHHTGEIANRERSISPSCNIHPIGI